MRALNAVLRDMRAFGLEMERDPLDDLEEDDRDPPHAVTGVDVARDSHWRDTFDYEPTEACASYDSRSEVVPTSQRPTIPVPGAPTSERPTIPAPSCRESGVRLKVQRPLSVVVVDAVVCDLSRDPRSEDFTR